jgi:hypothetical protein
MYIDRYVRAIKNMSLKRLYYALVRRIRYIINIISWRIKIGFSKDNKKRLRSYKDKHKGQRCFIIANGPSLKEIDFDLLKNEVTIGMNRAYLMEKNNNFMPTYLACIDDTAQLPQFTEEYNDVKIPCFYNWNFRKKFDKKDNIMYLIVRFSLGFSEDIVNDLTYNGCSVTYTCIQLAYYMGFKEVYLIGKDHLFVSPKTKDGIIISDGKEQNHFIGGYYKPGQIWHVPDHKTEEHAYEIARHAYEKSGKIIKDATIGGHLNVFEKVEFVSLFDKKRNKV